jgi:hypothetical protein
MGRPEYHSPWLQVKAINPNVSTVFYINAQYDFQWYNLNGMGLPLLRNPAGELMNVSWTGPPCHVFDFSNPLTSKLFIEECVNATQTGYVDGVFVGVSSPAVSLPARSPLCCLLLSVLCLPPAYLPMRPLCPPCRLCRRWLAAYRPTGEIEGMCGRPHSDAN